MTLLERRNEVSVGGGQEAEAEKEAKLEEERKFHDGDEESEEKILGMRCTIAKVMRRCDATRKRKGTFSKTF